MEKEEEEEEEKEEGVMEEEEASNLQVASCKCISLYGRNSHLQNSPHLELAQSHGSEKEVLSCGHGDGHTGKNP